MYIIHFPDIRLHNRMWWLIDPLGRVQLCFHMLFYSSVYAQVTISTYLLTINQMFSSAVQLRCSYKQHIMNSGLWCYSIMCQRTWFWNTANSERSDETTQYCLRSPRHLGPEYSFVCIHELYWTDWYFKNRKFSRTLAEWRSTLSFTDVSKSCQSREFK